MRSGSRRGVLGCHLCCRTGLFLCHSFCPLPAGAHSTAWCHSMHPGTGVCTACRKALTQQRACGRITAVDPEVTGDTQLQCPWRREHSESKAYNWEGRLPLASTPPKLFLRQPVHNGDVFALLVHRRYSPPHFQRVSIQEREGGREWNFVNHFTDEKEIRIASYFSY